MAFPDYKPNISQNIQFGQFKEKFNAMDFKSWFNSLNSHLYALRLDHHLTIDDAAEVLAAQANVLDATSNLIKINLVSSKLSGHCRILLKHCNATTYSIVACSRNLVCHK